MPSARRRWSRRPSATPPSPRSATASSCARAAHNFTKRTASRRRRPRPTRKRLRRISYEEAAERVRRGALWLDVRYPSEYQYDKLPGAINVPLAEVRNMFAVLDRSREYVAYCQSGRRSAAAAFLFAQRGFKVWLLDGGLRSVQKSA